LVDVFKTKFSIKDVSPSFKERLALAQRLKGLASEGIENEMLNS